jgi:hypothetical protein
MKKDWFKYRGYPHIASKVPVSRRGAIEWYVKSREFVAKHSFLPLISKNIIQRRYKRFDSYNSNVRAHYVMKDGKKVSSRKIRTIAYATHLDAHIYAFYNKEILEPKYEALLKENKRLNESVVAYRAIPTIDGKGNKNNIHFAKEVFDEIRNRQNCIAVLFDIENFFPSLDHKKLKKHWSLVLGCKSLPKDHFNIFKSVTNYSFFNLDDLRTKRGHFDEKRLAEIRNAGRDAYFESVKAFVESDIQVYKNPVQGKGIPQGLPISALLANIYMLEFDRSIIEKLTNKLGVFYRRYSDDMVFICKPSQVDEVKKIVKNEIENSLLKVSDDKTEEVLFKPTLMGSKTRLQSFRLINGEERENMPMSYLGFEFYGYKTLIKSKNLSSFYREMKQSVRRKSRRVEQRKANELKDELPIFKRKVYRLHSYHGIKKRILISNQGLEGRRHKKRLFRGNFIRYAFKASEILEAPEIKRQVRNHWKILQETINKYEFSNGKQSD